MAAALPQVPTATPARCYPDRGYRATMLRALRTLELGFDPRDSPLGFGLDSHDLSRVRGGNNTMGCGIGGGFAKQLADQPLMK
jgi:hypothetical protein